MESRAAYGYYGEGHGATGETATKVHASGWRMMDYRFTTSSMWRGEHETVGFTACDYDHALRNAKRWAKKNGIEILGDAAGWESQRTW